MIDAVFVAEGEKRGGGGERNNEFIKKCCLGQSMQHMPKQGQALGIKGSVTEWHNSQTPTEEMPSSYMVKWR